jgi:hypothetical protein
MDEVISVGFSPTADLLITGGKEGKLRLWNAHPPRRPATGLPVPVGASWIRLSSSGVLLLWSRAATA